MIRQLSFPVVLAVAIPSILSLGGCPDPSVTAENDPVTWLARPSLVVSPGALKVDVGLDRVVKSGEVFWLEAQTTGGVMPYTFAWSITSVEPRGSKPLVCHGDSPSACITAYSTCSFRVIVTDANGETATADVHVTVPR